VRWYFVFFLVSGFCSLVYEIVWLRLAMAQFGVTTALVSVVLSMYMAGLSLGSWVGGRLVRRFETHAASTPLRFYALTELLIGVSGISARHQFTWGHSLLERIGAEVTLSSSSYYLGAALWIALTLIPWCACMGATFPLAMSAIRQGWRTRSKLSFSYLYLANVLGAVLGTVIPAFLLIELLGFRRTLDVTAGLNGLIAASAFAVSLTAANFAPLTPKISEEGSRGILHSNPSKKGMLWLLFLTGLISMAMEIVWIRLFTPYLGNLVYAFATILALYLIATFLGSQSYRRVNRYGNSARSTFAWILVGVFGLIPLVSASPDLDLPESVAWSVFRVVLGVMPFSGAVGFLTPLLVDRWSLGDPDRAGRAYAINVLGSILGPLLAGFCLLPWLGERWSVITLTLPLLAIGLLAAVRSNIITGPVDRVRGARATYAFAVVLSLVLASAAESYEQQFPHSEVRRDYTATVIAAGQGMQKRLLVNGVGMTSLTPITKMMAHLPLAFLPGLPRNGLVIAFGMGTTFRSILSWGIPCTAVELVPSVPSLFGYYHPDGPRLLRSPLARIVIDDGRRFLERSTEQYDLITVDPPPPVEAAGSSLLYTKEFYLLAKKRLRPGGILQQWLPGGEPAVKTSIARALQESFPYVRVFQSVEGWGYHFLASMRPIPVTPASVLAGRLPPSAVQDLLEWGPYSTAEQQFSAVLARELPLEAIIASAPFVPALRDDRPLNEYFLLRRTLHFATGKNRVLTQSHF
jgi:predicted membrane-bound spermidine synthase